MRFIKLPMALLILLLAFGTSLAQDHPEGNTGEGVGDPMPGFLFTTTEGNVISSDALPQNQAAIVIYFDPYCDHCQKQAQWIAEQQHLFKEITLLWVSWGEMNEIQEFEKKFKAVYKNGNCIFTKDHKFQIDNYFGYSEVPSMYVYGPAFLRTATFRKETKPEILVSFAK